MAGRKVDTPLSGLSGRDDIPDLALPPPVARTSGSRPAVAPKPPKPPSPPAPKPSSPQLTAVNTRTAARVIGGGGREIEDDDPFGMSGGGSASIELDVAPMPPPPAVRTSMRASSVSLPAHGHVSPPATMESRVVAARARSMAPPRTHGGEAEAFGANAVDPYDARALADFGDAPDGLLGAPLYAFRVKTRQLELRRALSTCRLEAERAQSRLEDALVGFGERARAILQRTPGHHRLLEDIVAAERLVLERDGKLAGEMSAHRARADAVDARIVALEAALAAAKDELGRDPRTR